MILFLQRYTSERQLKMYQQRYFDSILKNEYQEKLKYLSIVHISTTDKYECYNTRHFA